MNTFGNFYEEEYVWSSRAATPPPPPQISRIFFCYGCSMEMVSSHSYLNAARLCAPFISV